MLEDFPILKKIFKIYIVCCIIGLVFACCYLLFLIGSVIIGMFFY